MPKKCAFRRMPRPPVIQPLDQPYRLIALTQNQVAIVDVEDFERINNFNWYAQWDIRTKSFYAIRSRAIHMEKEVLQCNSDEKFDHKNHDTLDNRRENLRKANRSQNCWNRKEFHPRNKSGYIGVCWHKRNNKWIASIGYKLALIHLGYFTSAEEAARARDETAKKLHGEFAILNFP